VLTLANSQESIAVAAQASTRALMNGHWSEEQRKFRKWAHDHPPGVSTGDEQMLLEKLPDCPVPREKLLDEFGEPLFTRTVTKATAVAAAVTSSAKELPVVVRPAFASVRSATLIAYRLAVVTRGWPRRVFLAGAAATALGILVAVVFGSVVGIAGGALAAAGIYLMLLVGVRAVTGWGWVLWCVLLALVGVAFFVMWAWHSWLFGKGNRSDFGVIGNHLLSWLNVTVLPWLRDDWWNTALVFAILLAIFAGIIYAVVRLFRHS
jgi:hypothetical protein